MCGGWNCFCDPLVASFNVLKRLPHVSDVTIFGQALHLTLDNDVSIDLLHQTLAEQQIHIHSLRDIEPSLEDVFVSLTEQARQEAEAEAAALSATSENEAFSL